ETPLILVESLIEEIAQVIAVLRSTIPKNRGESGDGVRIPVVVGRRVTQERHEVTRGDVSKSHDSGFGRPVDELVDHIAVEASRDADVGRTRGAWRSGRALCERPLLARHNLTVWDVWRARPR